MVPLRSAVDRILIGSAFAALLGLSAACRTIPNVPPPSPASGPSEFQIQIQNTQGPLRARDVKKVLAKLKAQAPNGDSLARHLAIEQGVAERPLYTSNAVKMLRDGEETFPAMFAAMHAAEHYIHLEYYIFEDVEWAGERLSDVLIAKRQSGVDVAVIYDAVGAAGTPAAFLNQLNEAGVKVLPFHPLNPLHAGRRFSLNDRDHRKLMVIDGRRAIVGGINMSHTYQSTPLKTGSGDPAPPGEKTQHWRDTDLEIRGPVVAELERLFVSHWASEKDSGLGDVEYVPPVAAQGSEVVRIIGSAPSKAAQRFYVALLAAVETAEAAVWITTGYFVPTHQEKKDLADAARRGVDVRLMLPSRSDSPASLAVQHSTYGDLLKAGVKIYEQDNAILHSKTVVVDRVWSAVGSSNFDHRSVLFNDEVDAVVIGKDTGESFARLFDQDVEQAHLVDRKTWRHRPLRERAVELFWRVWQRLL